MFTLLNPSALLALLGLLVPVAIHLWNRRPGHEVAVGSLRWLAAGANRRLRNLKPEQLWLLLLRAALLAVLAVALANPVWRQALPGGRGQVLLSPELLGNPAFATLRPQIDSLRRRGYALRWLAKGFSKVPGSVWRADSLGQRDSTAGLLALGQAAGAFRWARVREAAGVFAGQPLYVVTSNKLRDVQGTHSPLAANITWQTVPDAKAETWYQTAALRGDSLRLLLGRSTETQTTFRQIAVARPQPGAEVRVAGMPAMRLAAGANGPRLLPANQPANKPSAEPSAIAVRSQPVRVLIYSMPAYAADARYLRAGLRAAAAGLPVALQLSTTSTPPSPTPPADWLFWLSDAPLPAAWHEAVRKGAHVWQEAPGAGAADTASLAMTAAEEALVTLFRRDKAPPASTLSAGTVPIWADGRGRAVLSRREFGKGAVYQLHTRLSPAWSEIADSPILPTQLLSLLEPELAESTLPAAAHDQRALDPAQFSLTNSKLKSAATFGTVAPAVFRSTDLRPWLVLAAGLLFALERLLARRREAAALSSTS